MLGSDCSGQFVERCGNCEAREGVDTEFVVAPSFDPAVRVLGGVVMGRRRQLDDARANAADLSVVTTVGTPCERIDVVKNRCAAFVSRLSGTNTSMTCPYWSTARYTYRHTPATLT